MVGNVTNVGKKVGSCVGSRVASEVLAVGCTVASTHQCFCSPQFVHNPDAYAAKNGKSNVCIDYFMYSGSVGVGTHSIGVEPACLLYRFNDHFPIGGIFTIPLSCYGGSSPARRRFPYDVSRVGEPRADAEFLELVSSAPPHSFNG